jgi:ATP-binding cassette subfamily C protein
MDTAGLERNLAGVLFLIAAGFAVKNAVLWFTRRQVGYQVARVVRDLRLRLIRALMLARWSYFVTRPVGSFGNAYNTEADRTAKAYFSGAMCIAVAIQLVKHPWVIGWGHDHQDVDEILGGRPDERRPANVDLFN